jgi:hypothetical protein
MQSKKINELGTNVAPSVNDLTVVGDAATGQLKKITLSQISSLFGSTGSVSSVAMTVPTGLTVTGSPITTSGTLALTLTAGYSIPTTAKQSEWDTGYAERLKWDGGASGLNAATARTSLGLVIGTNVLAYRTFGSAANNNTGDFATAAQGANADTAYSLRLTGASLPLSISSNVISITQASTSANGYLSSTDWNTFNGKQAALGFTPYNATNPAGYLSSVSLTTNVTGVLPIANGGTGSTTASAARTALGLSIGSDVLAYRTFGSAANNNTSDFYASSNPSGYITSSALSPYQLQINGTGFVKASGTTISYDNTSYLSLTGGTLTGALGGTSATFSGDVTIGAASQLYLTSGDLRYNSNAGFGIVTQNGGRLVSIQNGALGVNGAATFSNIATINNADQSGARLVISNTGSGGQAVNLVAGNPNVDNTGFSIAYGNTNFLRFASSGAATFSSSVTATSFTVSDVIINSNQIYRNGSSEFYVNYSGTGHTLLGNGTGNVGINAGTNPSFRLQVGGTLGVSGAATFSELVTNYNVYNTQTASYTLVLADASKIVEMNVGSANTVTIPTNASVAFPIGTEITVLQYGAGVTSIAVASGVTIVSKDNANIIANRYSGVTLIKRATNEWYLIGNIIV